MMKKYKIGYTQGTFDMFHIGHLNLLHQAKELCEELIVGVNTDQLVSDYKHKVPVINECDRAAIIGELRCVDKVVLCDTLKKTDAYATVIGPVTIGDDVTIGACAIVTKDVPSHSVVKGLNQIRPKRPEEIPEKYKDGR